MFSLRLKSWMEAHLGRPRHKSSTHQNQKNHRAPKDSSVSTAAGGGSGSGGSSCSGTTVTNNTTTTVTTSVSLPLSSSNSNPYPVDSYVLQEQNSNLDSSPSSEFSSTTSPSCSSVQVVQSGSVHTVTAQHQKQQQDLEEQSGKDHEEKLQESHQRTTCTRSSTTGSVSNSTSNSILLGSFSNNLNLSSPDTGYSTDGYSPKSVYPALSFESSGKSTPKSSYTISSLVSSELLQSSKHTASLSSASCSVQNGLESDHECVSPLLKTSTSLLSHPETNRPNSGHSSIDRGSNDRNPKGDSPIGQHQPSSNSHSIKHETEPLSPVTFTPSTQDLSRGNDTVASKQCNSTNSSVSHVNECSSHSNCENMVAQKTTLNSSYGSSHSEANGSCKHFTGISNTTFNNNNKSYVLTSLTPENNNLLRNNQHRRTESMDESIKVSDTVGGNSSSLLTGPGNRNIRTSFVLVTSATSQIPECNLGLKNTFSICSPRRERTRIKTNPWITLSQHNNDGNSNANSRINTTEVIGMGETYICRKTSSHAVSDSTCTEKVAFHQACNANDLSSSPRNIQKGINSSNVCSKTVPEINNKNQIDGEADGGERRMLDHHTDSSSLVYRISTSTSASDSGLGSGKESLEPGTNRNSTESSCLLSDSASTRNSIISHEAEPGSSESRSRSSSSSATPDTFSNGHDGTFFTTSKGSENLKTLTQQQQQQQQQSHHQLDFSTSANQVFLPVSSSKNTPICMTKSVPQGTTILSSSYQNNSSHISEPKSEQDVTTESITLPPGLISTSASVSAQTNIIMVDKETDILSDWANTDEDGEDEIETDGNDNEEEGVTPTPSSPDTDTGGRVIFPNSQSTSSATDIDFGDSSAATAASSTCIFPPSSSAFRHHNCFQNINKHSSNGTAAAAAQPSYHHHNTMNLPTTCYQPIPIIPIAPGGIPVDIINIPDRKDAYWNHTEPLVNHVFIQPTDFVGLPVGGGERCSTNTTQGPVLGIPNANLSLSSMYSGSLIEPADYNANKSQQSSSPHALARGALGFLRKIFKKGSCSSHRTSPGSDRIKVSRSGKGKDSHLDNVTGLRSPLLTADALVSHQLVGRKSTLNGYFLTPTPNAFRRRSGTGTDSSDSKQSSKHHKSVKTDIIRLLPGALSPNQHSHNNIQNSSSSTSSSQNTTSIGAFCISSLQNNTFGTGTNTLGYSNTNTNSTTASSAHSMSTSTSATSTGVTSSQHQHQNVNNKTPIQNQSRLNDNFYSNSNPNRQSPYMSNHQNVGYIMPPILNPIGTHSTTTTTKPQLPALPPVPVRMPSPYLQNTSTTTTDITSQSQTVHQQRDFPAHPSTAKTGPGPYESPRLQNPNPTHRINSPSFNNYSPIHRLVVTGGNHLLNRGPPIPSYQHLNNQSQSASAVSSYNTESPRLTSRNGNCSSSPLQTPRNVQSHNNNSTFTSIINRPGHSTSSPSPLINHRQSISSPHSHQSSGYPQSSGSHTFASPSPILRNPRYQYITSSNQNSPVLNVPKRIHLPAPQQQQQHYYYHNQGHGILFPPPSSNPNGPPSSSTFSPIPPPRQNANNNPFSVASPNLNHQNQYSPSKSKVRPHRSGSLQHGEFENVNVSNLQVGTTIENTPTSSTSNNRSNIISRSQSYQAQQIHYYASPVIPQPPLPLQQRIQPHPLHPSGFSLNEPPLLMRTHLHNQNIRLNNFMMNKQRHFQNNGASRFPNSESFQERIYETVDSEDENSDEGETNGSREIGISIHDMQHHKQDKKMYSSSSTNNVERRNSSSPVVPASKSDFQYSHKSKNPVRIQQSSTSKRSKPSQSQTASVHHQNQQPRPPVPMALFGPNTFLSETETRLLEVDREADRKYKRLINEAEALLREISAVKSQQPWAHREQDDRFRFEECPQSDPLRRKAYDCWALRRLQQELAGCCASPPVLHRSRMNLQSPSTPTASSHPYNITSNLSVLPNPLQQIKPNINDNNRNNANF